ncbi:MAG: TonB-dependent receptor domain-containing protein [Candidatus Acidiferrales bacterium]
MKTDDRKCGREAVGTVKFASMNMRRLRAFVIGSAAALLLLCGNPGKAQTFRGTILGTVTDSSGAAVSGATVTVKNVDTGLVRTAATGDDGSYSVPELPIGNYSVTVEMNGFKSGVVSGIRVEVSSERRADVTLQPGALAQTVEVSGEALPLVETTSNTLGGAFESKQVEDLPINGRDYTKLLINVPGAAGEPNGAGDSPGSFGYVAVNGNRGRANNFMLDGTDENDGYRNDPAINEGGVFGTPGTVLPLDAIAEVRVLSNFEPEYGRNAGGVINIVTKSGTNNYHGSAYEYFRNDHLNARNFFNTVGNKDAFRNNQYGGTLGGPVAKDKTFFFLAYEGQREGGAITSLNVVPSVADFQNAITNIKNTTNPAADPTQCTTTIIACVTGQPGGVVNPVILNLFNFCQSKGKCSGGKNIWPGVNIANAASGAANSVDGVRFSNNINSMIVKIDHAINKDNQLSGRYFFGDSTQSFPLGLAGGNNLPGTNTVAPIRTQLVSVSLVSTISSNTVNEARFGWNRYRNGFYPEDAGVFGNPDTSLGLNLGVTNPRDFGLPTIRFLTLSFLGSSPFSNPRDRVDANWQAIDGLSWKHGSHDIKIGYEFRATTVRSFNDFSARGVLVFGPTETGTTVTTPELANFLMGSPSNTALFSSRIVTGVTDRDARQGNDALYVQDSFRWTRNFTLNMGLRWDYFGVIHEAQGLFSVYDPTAGLVHRDPLYNKDFRSFSPRTSLAWDVTGKQKTVIRAGFGVFYDDFSQDAFTGQIYENSFNAGVAYNAIGPDPVFLNKTFAAGAIPIKPGMQIFTTTPATGPAPSQTTDASTVDQHMRNPYVYNFNLNVQQELFKNTMLQIGYVGSSGHKLLRLRDINQPNQATITAADLACNCINDFATPRNFTTPLSAIAPNAPFIVNQLESSAVSHYHSLQTSLSQQNFHGWTNQITYTWSHSIDTASDSQDYVPNAAESQDGTNTAAEKGPSNFDLRNRFVWSSSYDLPKWKSWGRMGEGWMLSGVATIASGHPFSMNYNTIDDYSGSGSSVDRPDVVGPIQYNQSDPTHYLNLNSFAMPCTPNGTGTGFAFDTCTPGTRHFGNLGRNALMGPNYRNMDLAISKVTSITERLKLLFRVDAYNLLNHPNFASPLAVAFFADAAPNRSLQFPAGMNPVTGRHIGNLAITATSDVGVGNPVLGGGGTRSLQLSVKLQF